MKIPRLKCYKSEIFTIIICTLCLQMPDLKLGSIKISEVVMLLFLPFYIKEVFKNKTLSYFLVFYLVFFLKTVILNQFTQFYINDTLPILKHPYFISLSRLIEMMACLVFCVFIYNEIKTNNKPLLLIKKFLFVQIFCFGSLYIFVFLLYKLHILHTTSYDNIIVYDTSAGDMVYRLKGFYVEGGPFGLFNAFLFTLCVAFYKKLSLNPFHIILCLIMVLLAESKAGYLMVVLTSVVFLFLKIRENFKNIFFKGSIYLISVAILISLGFIISAGYLNQMVNLEEQSAQFSPSELDPSVMLGRISASVIAPNMVKNNLFSGIGWGNYPLLRNNPNYRLFMPEIPVNLWDSTGFGGAIDLIIEGGLVMFLIYLSLYYRVYKLIKRYIAESSYIVLSFVGPLLLGVSIYFFYTWFLLGIILFLVNFQKKIKNELVPGIE
jgi:hypothetical protein